MQEEKSTKRRSPSVEADVTRTRKHAEETRRHAARARERTPAKTSGLEGALGSRSREREAASGLCGKGNSVSARACRAVPAFAGNRAEPWPFAREMRATRGESLSSSFASASAARHTVGYTCARSCCLFVSAGPTAAENVRPAPTFQPSGPPNADSRS